MALLSDYLESSYRPDREFVDGELLERNVGEWDHNRLQSLVGGYLVERERQLGILAAFAARVQVSETRVRVPDVMVLHGAAPTGPIVTKPPFLCIEILSPSDRMTEMQDRIDDYLAFGVRYVSVIDQVIDPSTRPAFAYPANRVQEVNDGILCTEQPDIRVPLYELG